MLFRSSVISFKLRCVCSSNSLAKKSADLRMKNYRRQYSYFLVKIDLRKKNFIFGNFQRFLKIF